MCKCLCSSLRWICSCFGRQSRKKKRNLNKSNYELRAESSEKGKRKRRRGLSISSKKLIKEKKGDSVFDTKTFSKIEVHEITKEYSIPRDGSSESEILQSRNIKLIGENRDKPDIGEGSYGKVYKAEKIIKHKTRIYACKMIHIEPEKRTKIMNLLKNEIYAMETIQYEFVISLNEHFIIDDTAYIFMDYADGGNLTEELKKIDNVNGFNEETAKEYFGQIVLGVGYMHRKHLAHRDLKCENILLMTSGDKKIVQIADFGLSKLVYYVKDDIVGTTEYMSPQLMHNKLVGRKSPSYRKTDPFNDDVYALGVILFKMLTNKLPFEDCETLNTHYKHQKKLIWFGYTDKLRKTKVNEVLHHLLKPGEPRINLSDIVALEWLKGYTKITDTTSSTLRR